MEKEMFVCPLCNAPHSEELQPGTLQVKCKYCGGVILVPLRLSGLYDHCPVHPNLLSVGLCSRCGRKCCEQCLHVLEMGRTTVYLCPTCTKRHQHEQRAAFYCSILAGLAILPIVSLAAFRPRSSPSAFGSALTFVLFGLVAIMAILCGAFAEPVSSDVPTLEETRHPKGSPGSTWAVCPICNAGYFYGAVRIGPERTVTCQNCGRQFQL